MIPTPPRNLLLFQPRVINVDGHLAYPAAINMNRSGDLSLALPLLSGGRYVDYRTEQDHRFVKKRVVIGQWFKSADGGLNTIAGYEAINIIRTGQIRWSPEGSQPV